MKGTWDEYKQAGLNGSGSNYSVPKSWFLRRINIQKAEKYNYV